MLMGSRKHSRICPLEIIQAVKINLLAHKVIILWMKFVFMTELFASEVSLYHLEKPKLPLGDSNFQYAVNLWFSELNATMTYGHISDWNVSVVTDMSEAFRNRTTLMRISAMDVVMSLI